MLRLWLAEDMLELKWNLREAETLPLLYCFLQLSWGAEVYNVIHDPR